MNKRLIILIIIAISATIMYVISGYTPKNIVPCSQEVKICPNGSTILRTGPNCEFAPCPTIIVTPSNTKTETNVDCGGWDTSGEIICECSGKIIKPTCPPNAVCDSGAYKCEGQCGMCCYKGIAKGIKYPYCN
jgi:hypothetical protein